MTSKPTFDIRFPPPSATSDKVLLAHLTNLINSVYTTAEAGIFSTSGHRTTQPQLATLLANREVALAYCPSSHSTSHPVGCVRIHKPSPTIASIGMLVASPSLRGTGLGTQLMDFAEDVGRQLDVETLQLELLLPTTWKHEGKEFLQQWYARRGYDLVRVDDFASDYPEPAKALVTEVEFRILQKEAGVP